MTIRFVAASLSSLILLAAPALAQDHSGHGMDHGTALLPPICGTAPHEMAMGEPGPTADPAMDEAHAALFATMDPMHAGMAQGMMAEDFDVAFICGMVPHHQGAVDMAKVMLEHGTDPWARELAQAIIDAQEKEIAQMRAWLEARAP